MTSILNQSNLTRDEIVNLLDAAKQVRARVQFNNTKAAFISIDKRDAYQAIMDTGSYFVRASFINQTLFIG